MPRGPTLKTTGDVASFLARITREAYTGKLEIDTARGLGYLCAQLMKALDASVVEEKIEALAAQIEELKGKGVRIAQ